MSSSDERLFKEALSSSYTPSEELNKKLLSKMEVHMRKQRKPILRPLFIAAIIVILATTTAFAAWRLLSPADLAENLRYPTLADAFRSDGAVLVNETRSQAGYDVTFLGVVSGRRLTELDETLDTGKTYAVVAIENQGGVMPDTSDNAYDSQPFFISPLINGQQPWMVNIASMSGGYSSQVIDGVMYRIVECDNVEIFADRGLWLCVSSTTFFSVEAFNYDADTGTVSPNPQFDGVNMLFDLPLDKSKADHEKAEEYLNGMFQ